MQHDIIHPDLLSSLHRFFVSTCTIQSATQVRDSFGEEQPTWANLAGHIAIPCAIAPAPGGKEIKRPDMTYVVTTHTVALAGDYPAVTELMRAIVGTLTLDIMSVEHDSHAITTRLACLIVE